jgi:MIP family channel proteins
MRDEAQNPIREFSLKEFLSGVPRLAFREFLSTSTLSQKLAAEVVGTFLFVLVGAGSAIGTFTVLRLDPVSSVIAAALANGIGLAVAVTATMGISGGVLNPAVAVGLLAGGKLQAKDVVPYILAELMGAVAAGFTLVLVFPIAIGNAVQWGSPSLNSLVTVGQGLSIEALLTFVLVIAVFGTAVDSRAHKLGGLGIGLAVVADVLVAGNLTGAAMNPARAYGPMLAAGFIPNYWYIYTVGPVLGAILAGLVYRYLLETKQP